MSQLTSVKTFILRHVLVESFFVIALIVWSGLLPLEYLLEIGLRSRPGHAYGFVGDDAASGKYLAELAGLGAPHWITWHDGAVCRVIAVVNDEVRRALLGGQFFRRNNASTVGPQGMPVETSRYTSLGKCTHHLQNVARVLREAQHLFWRSKSL